MVTKPELFNMVAQKKALLLELKGLKFSRGSVYAHIKKTYGLRGNRQRVYTQFCELVEKAKGEIEDQRPCARVRAAHDAPYGKLEQP